MIVFLISCVAPTTSSDSLVLAQSYADVTNHGAVSGDALDDAPAFHQALDTVQGSNDPERVVYVPNGLYNLINVGNQKWGLRIDIGNLLFQCESKGYRDGECTTTADCSDGVCDMGECVFGTMLQGDLAPWEHLGSDWASKDLISVGPPTGSSGIRNITFANCAIEFQRPHAANEQAHGIVLTSMFGGAWTRDVTIRDVVFGPIGSGDGVYCGSSCEDLILERVEVRDPARAGVAIAGHAQTVGRRNGFTFSDLDVHWTGHNPEQEGGPSVDFEVSQPQIRVGGIDIRRVRASGATMHLSHIDGGIVEDVTTSRLALGRVDGLDVVEPSVSCLPGNGGDGVGYCISLFRPPSNVAFINGVYEVNLDGAGFLYVRDYRSDPKVTLPEQHYRVEVLGGRVRLNGGHLIRPDILADPLLVHVDVQEIP